MRTADLRDVGRVYAARALGLASILAGMALDALDVIRRRPSGGEQEECPLQQLRDVRG